jgi:hypothetical protein
MQMDIRAFRLAARAFFDGKSSACDGCDGEDALAALPLSIPAQEPSGLPRAAPARPGEKAREALE